MIGQYGAGARVVDVARDLLSRLGAPYQRALLAAQRTPVLAEIATITKERNDKASLVVLIDEEIANLDPLSPTYASDLADLLSSRASTTARITAITTTELPTRNATVATLNAAMAVLAPSPSAYLQQNLDDWVYALTKIAPAALAATLGDFASANGIRIDDARAVAVATSWGSGFGGVLTADGRSYPYALTSAQLVDEGAFRTANRDYSYTMSAGLITVNVQVTTHYYGFLAIGAADASAVPADIPALGPLALALLALVVGGIGARSMRRR